MKTWKIALAISLLSILSGMAQTQQGIVKTKGRLNSDGSVSAGQRIAGASITVRGRTTVLSKQNGTFSFPIPGKVYYLQSVQKQGYVLTDPDVLTRQYAYSLNPLELVLETPEQQADDRLAAERQIRRTLRQQLQAKENEIEALRNEKKLSDEAYRKQMQELYTAQESNEKLISEMAEHYSKIDFDKVDDSNRRISQFILDGRLTDADSMLNAKGDIASRAITLRQHQDANEKAEKDISKKQKKLEKSKALTQKEMEDLAQDCYSKFEILKMQHQNDSAAYYIELRAGLDTTNVDWTIQAGDFIETYISDYDKTLELYQRALRNAIARHGELSKETADAYTAIGGILTVRDKQIEALENFRKSLEIVIQLFGDNHPITATDYINIATSYNRIGNFSTSLEYLQKAMTIYNAQSITDHRLAHLFINLAYTHACLADYGHAAEYLEKAQDYYLSINEDKSIDMATIYMDLAGILADQAHYAKSEEYCKKSLSILKNIFGENHPRIAQGNMLLSAIYTYQGKFTEALEIAKKTLDIQIQVFGPLHSTVASSQQAVGYIYSFLGNNEKCLEYNLKALEIFQQSGLRTPILAQSYNNVGYLSYLLGKNQEALDYHLKALEIRKECMGEKHPDVAQSYDNIGMVQFAMDDIDAALKSHQTALKIRLEIHSKEHPDLSWSYIGIGDVLCKQGKYEEAIDHFNKAYTVRKNGFGEKNPDTIHCLTKIGGAYREKGDKAQALSFYKEALEKYREIYGDDYQTTKEIQEIVNSLTQ